MRYFAILLLLMTSSLYGQKNDTIPYKALTHSMAVKWSPIHMFSFYPTLQIAFEHRIASQVALQWEGGYVVDDDGSYEHKNGFDKRGFKAKVDVRQYYPVGYRGRHAFFVAPELGYTYVDYKKAGTFGMECNSDDCLYYRYYTYNVEYREWATTLKAGFINRFGRHFSLEYHVGLSLRFIRYRTVNKPQGESYEERYEGNFLDFSPEEKSRNILFPAVGVRLGYIFR